MKNKVFGSLVAGAVTSMFLAGAAMAQDDAAPAPKKDHHSKKGWCKSNSCKGAVEGAKNDCNGKMACKGVKKEACEKDGKGTWSTDKKPG